MREFERAEGHLVPCLDEGVVVADLAIGKDHWLMSDESFRYYAQGVKVVVAGTYLFQSIPSPCHLPLGPSILQARSWLSCQSPSASPSNPLYWY